MNIRFDDGYGVDFFSCSSKMRNNHYCNNGCNNGCGHYGPYFSGSDDYKNGIAYYPISRKEFKQLLRMIKK